MKLRREKQDMPKKVKAKKAPVLHMGLRRKTTIVLWLLLAFSLAFAIYKNFTAIDTHTVHEVEIIETKIIDTNRIESFVENFANIFYTWDNSRDAIDERTEKLKGFLTEELQMLNMDMVTANTESSSTIEDFQVWDVLLLDDNNFQILFSVRQLVTAITCEAVYDYVEEPSMNEVYNPETGEAEYVESATEKQIASQVETTSERWIMSYYTVVVHMDENGGMVITRNPTISGAPEKSGYEPTAVTSDGTVDSTAQAEVDEFLTTFFKLYPTASETELSYYVKDTVLAPVDTEYEFGDIINPVYSAKDGQITARFAVSYYDTVTMTTQVSQYVFTLEKSETGNYMIVGAGV